MNNSIRVWSLSFLLMLISFSYIFAGPEVADTVAISYGETKTGAISVNGEVDIFQFNGSVGDIVIIQMHSTNGSDSLDSRIVLNSPTGTSLNKSQSRGLARIDRVTLNESGVYEIQVSDGGNDTTGTYAISLQKINPPVNSTLVNFGDLLTDSLTQFTEMKTYTFSGSSGGIIVSQILNQSLSTGIQVELYDPNGLQIKKLAGSSFVRTDTVHLNVTGTYSFLITAISGASVGSFQLTLESTDSPSITRNLTFGQVLTDSLSSPIGIKVFQFSATAGEAILSQAKGISANFKIRFEVFDPSGELIYDQSTTGLLHSASVPLNTTGTYYIFITDFNATSTASFALFVQNLNLPVGAIATSYGSAHNDTTTHAIQMRTFTFNSDSGDVATVITRSLDPAFRPAMEIYDSTGVLLRHVQDNTVTRIDTITFPHAGPFILFV